jgi:uncharacterized protein (DUF2267 family)
MAKGRHISPLVFPVGADAIRPWFGLRPTGDGLSADAKACVVDYESFLEIVAQHSADGRESAERASRATLQTLAERIDREEARQIAAQLPPELAPWIATTSPAEGFDTDEFLRRVARREDVDAAVARHHVRAVFDALARTVSADEWHDLVSELPGSFAPLLPRGRHIEVLDATTFVQRVAEHAGIDDESAWRATDALLRTLAERIAGGEVDDLIERVPMELHDALERGRAATNGRALPMSFERFMQRVAKREGATDPVATEHARAVFAVLREAIGDEEFFDVVVQLPDEYARVLGLGASDRERRPA